MPLIANNAPVSNSSRQGVTVAQQRLAILTASIPRLAGKGLKVIAISDSWAAKAHRASDQSSSVLADNGLDSHIERPLCQSLLLLTRPKTISIPRRQRGAWRGNRLQWAGNTSPGPSDFSESNCICVRDARNNLLPFCLAHPGRLVLMGSALH